MGSGIFTPVIYRPLFDHLRLVTCRTFGNPAANTIPSSASILICRGNLWVAAPVANAGAGSSEELVLTCLLHPQRYGEIVAEMRGSLAKSTHMLRVPRTGRDCRGMSGPKTRATYPAPAPGWIRNRLRYGVNEATGWRDFATGQIANRFSRDRLRAIGPGSSAFTCSPLYTRSGKRLAGLQPNSQAVLDAGATPMIHPDTISPAVDDSATMRWFVQRCGELAVECIENGAARSCGIGIGALERAE